MSKIVEQRWYLSERQTHFPCYLCGKLCGTFIKAIAERKNSGLYPDVLQTYAYYLCQDCYHSLKPRNDKAA